MCNLLRSPFIPSVQMQLINGFTRRKFRSVDYVQKGLCRAEEGALRDAYFLALLYLGRVLEGALEELERRRAIDIREINKYFRFNSGTTGVKINHFDLRRYKEIGGVSEVEFRGFKNMLGVCLRILRLKISELIALHFSLVVGGI